MVEAASRRYFAACTLVGGLQNAKFSFLQIAKSKKLQ